MRRSSSCSPAHGVEKQKQKKRHRVLYDAMSLGVRKRPTGLGKVTPCAFVGARCSRMAQSRLNQGPPPSASTPLILPARSACPALAGSVIPPLSLPKPSPSFHPDEEGKSGKVTTQSRMHRGVTRTRESDCGSSGGVSLLGGQGVSYFCFKNSPPRKNCHSRS